MSLIYPKVWEEPASSKATLTDEQRLSVKKAVADAVDAKGKPMPLKDGLEMAQKKIRKDYSMCLPDDVVVEIVKELVAERMPVAKPIEFPVLPLELPVVEK